MKKGERRVVRTRCAECRAKVIVRSPAGSSPFSAEDAAEMETSYVCADCEVKQ